MYGVYAGIQYLVTVKDGKRYIGIQDMNFVTKLVAAGIDVTVLDDIGDQQPDDVVQGLLESLLAASTKASPD